jgi:hypothetical protein
MNGAPSAPVDGKGLEVLFLLSLLSEYITIITFPRLILYTKYSGFNKLDEQSTKQQFSTIRHINVKD